MKDPIFRLDGTEYITDLIAQARRDGKHTATVQGRGLAAAASFILFVPNLLLFIVMQTNVMNTMAHSGLKG